MKKLNLILMITMTVFIFSCEKKENIQPVKEQVTQQTQTPSIQYNESNTQAISWNQLPEALRNAENIKVESEQVSKINASYITSVGPWGGGGGSGFSIYPTASTDKIYAIAIRSGAYVDALSVWYIRTNGTLYSYSVGGTGGSFYFQAFSPTERITAFAGRSGAYLDRLTIYTNYKSFSYGGNGGSAFYAGAGANQILGFYGGSGIYVDRIGAYIYSL